MTIKYALSRGRHSWSVWVAMMGLGAAVPATASDCFDYSPYMHWLGAGTHSSQLPLDVLEIDGLAYVAGCCTGSIDVYDLSDVADPLLVTSYPTTGTVSDLERVGSLLYVADNSSGLNIFDVADAADPQPVFQGDTGNAQHVEIVGSLAYVLYDSSLSVFDVSTPSAPALLGSVAQGGTGFAVNGTVAYVVPSFKTIDVSDPADMSVAVEDWGPFQLGAYDSENEGQVEIRDGLLFLANSLYDFPATEWDGDRCLGTFAVSPDQPVPAELDLVLLHGGNQNSRILVDPQEQVVYWGQTPVDYSDPGNLPSLTDGGWGGSPILRSESLIFFQSDGVVEEYARGEVAPPNLVSELVGVGSREVMSLTTIGSQTILGLSNPVQLIDVTDPANPSLLTTLAGTEYDTFGTNGALRFSGDRMVRLYNTFPEQSRIDIYDGSDPVNPDLLGTWHAEDTYPPVTDIEVVGSKVYVARSIVNGGGNGGGFRILDISDPLDVEVLGALAIDAAWVAVDGNFAYLNDGETLTVVDVSDASNPLQRGSIPVTTQWGDVQAKDGYVYMSADGGLQVVDATDPQNPVLGTFIFGRTGRVERNGDYLSLGAQVVFDVSNPGSPAVVPWAQQPDADTFFLGPDQLYTAFDYFDGAMIQEGLQVCDLPCLETTTDVPSQPEAFFDASTLAAWPNPASGRQTFQWRSPDSKGSPVVIVDAGGRLVRTLAPTRAGSGTDSGADAGADAETVAIWDGRDRWGHLVAAGVYFARVAGEHSEATVVRLAR